MVGTYIVEPRDDMYGDNLKRLIKENGLTQRKLAEIADLPHQTIESHVSKRRSPTLYSLRKIRHALDCTWDDLLGEQ